MRPKLGLLLVCALLTASLSGASVDEAWLEVQEVLSAPEGRSFQEPIDDLINAAEETDVRRMTSYAAALVSWSHANPDGDPLVLETATIIDSTARVCTSKDGWRVFDSR